MTVLVLDADLGGGIGAWFTGRDVAAPGAPDGDGAPDRARAAEVADAAEVVVAAEVADAAEVVGAAGNLSHRRPHRPAGLAATRARVGTRIGHAPPSWVTMHQVHGADVGIVDAETPPGAEVRGVDALVTAQPSRPLAVAVADCVPVLLATDGVVGAAHAGRLGVQHGVVPAALEAMTRLGATIEAVRAAVGPAIGGCCYEVPAAMHAAVVAEHPDADARTRWGTPSLDLPAAVTAQLTAAGVERVVRVGGCTRCDPEQRFFSHRADPTTGRQLGLIVREGAAA